MLSGLTQILSPQLNALMGTRLVSRYDKSVQSRAILRAEITADYARSTCLEWRYCYQMSGVASRIYRKCQIQLAQSLDVGADWTLSGPLPCNERPTQQKAVHIMPTSLHQFPERVLKWIVYCLVIYKTRDAALKPKHTISDFPLQLFCGHKNQLRSRSSGRALKIVE